MGQNLCVVTIDSKIALHCTEEMDTSDSWLDDCGDM